MKVIAVASGKGGVGKSTLSVNLAVAFAKQGFNTGLLDADLYGPSIPIMMGLRQLTPKKINLPDGKTSFLPMTKFGVHTLSFGFFLEEATPATWRGPVLHTTLQKMLNQVTWPDLDFLIIDLPPGTGDVLISLTQSFQLYGALIICTPQQVALLDALKAINAFYQLETPVLGLIENMATYVHPSTKEATPIFGQGGALNLAQRMNIPFLGSIPLLPDLSASCDEGIPAAFQTRPSCGGDHFHHLAQSLLGSFSWT